MAAVIAATLMVSCQKDNTIQYNNATMGNIVEGKFISDQGNIFNVVDQQCIGDLQSMNRAFVVCDVLSRTAGGSENEYDVRVNQIATVVTKDPVYHTEVTEAMMTQDPVHVENAWIAGGYINMLVSFDVKTGSKTKHLVNLVFDKEASTGNQYVFNLRHNSFGESLIYGTADSQLAHNYVSFPITDIIKDNTAEIIINWTWFKSNGFEWTNETQDYSCKMTYTKGGFEQAPVAIASKVTTNLN